MKYLRQRVLVDACILALLATVSTAKASPPFEGAEPNDIILTLKFLRNPEYAAMAPALLPLLHRENPNVVRDTCRTLAVIANKDVIPNIEPLLKDERSDVRKDAQDAIAQLRADHPQDHRGAAMRTSRPLESFDPKDIIRILKLLRSPEFAAIVPAILPLLHYESDNVVRDTCRTLAVIANKDVIPSIEPLLKNHPPKVQKDAQDAIDKLRAKS